MRANNSCCFRTPAFTRASSWCMSIEGSGNYALGLQHAPQAASDTGSGDTGSGDKAHHTGSGDKAHHTVSAHTPHHTCTAIQQSLCGPKRSAEGPCHKMHLQSHQSARQARHPDSHHWAHPPLPQPQDPATPDSPPQHRPSPRVSSASHDDVRGVPCNVTLRFYHPSTPLLPSINPLASMSRALSTIYELPCINSLPRANLWTRHSNTAENTHLPS
jgi:hypothetical protein